ncbi:MAG TPA: 3-dehydroquinate synthase [bacterium]|nr:3-dehydroquinate synthase [bacterium]
MRSVRVELQRMVSPIHIGFGLLERMPELLARHNLQGELVIISDERVAGLYGERLLTALGAAGRSAHFLRVPEGEGAKSLEQCEVLWRKLISGGFSRSTIILALGGGVVGDLAGFVASTFLRGVRLVQIPTTLLAQVDSSVGGKTGINHPLGKNLIGAFHQPELVCIDPALLATLERRDRLAGLGEVAKYALIRDRALFTLLALNLETLTELAYPELCESIIETSCTIKAAIVSADERERGERVLLNFGHTIGHALEAAGGFSHFRHGEAVIRGMAGAIWLSRRIGRLSRAEAQTALDLLTRLAPPAPPPGLRPADLLAWMARDKKRGPEGQTWILLEGVGKAFITREVAEDLLPPALAFACAGEWRAP